MWVAALCHADSCRATMKERQCLRVYTETLVNSLKFCWEEDTAALTRDSPQDLGVNFMMSMAPSSCHYSFSWHCFDTTLLTVP